jgi:hypothetical protein
LKEGNKMNEHERKKALRQSYRERKVTGGGFRVVNTKSGRFFLKGETDLKGAENRFEFSHLTDTCFHPAMQSDWKTFGKEAFAFEVLEELSKKDTQTDREFREDVALLEEIWADKLGKDRRYI